MPRGVPNSSSFAPDLLKLATQLKALESKEELDKVQKLTNLLGQKSAIEAQIAELAGVVRKRRGRKPGPKPGPKPPGGLRPKSTSKSSKKAALAKKLLESSGEDEE